MKKDTRLAELRQKIQARLEGLEESEQFGVLRGAYVDVMTDVDRLLGRVDPSLARKREAAWYEASALICGPGVPVVPYNGDTKHLSESEYYRVVCFFVDNGPPWITGSDTLSSIDLMVDGADENGNLESWDASRVLGLMRRRKVAVSETPES